MLTTLPPGVTSAPVSNGAVLRFCDFEDGSTMCGFTQDNRDDFDWSLTSQGTGTLQTGPANDHTLQTPQGQFYLHKLSYNFLFVVEYFVIHKNGMHLVHI